MKLDVFNHVFPEVFIETLEETMPKRAVARWRSIETLWNMDARLRLLDEFGDYQQIVSMSQPPIDVLGGPERTPALARIANDGMAAICRAHPDRFPSFPPEPADEQPGRSGERSRPGGDRARRLRRPDPFQRQRPRARRPGVLSGVRASGAPGQTGIPASGPADVAFGLPSRGRVQIRNILGSRLGLRNLRCDGSHRVLGHVRQAA